MDKIQQKKIELLIQDIKLDFKYFDIQEQKLDRIIGICKQQQTIIEALVERAFKQSDKKEPLQKIKIHDCSISPRLSNLMCNYGYEYLEDVNEFWIANGDNGLLKMKSFGRKSLNELKEIFAEYDLPMTTKYDLRNPKQETKNND